MLFREISTHQLDCRYRSLSFKHAFQLCFTRENVYSCILINPEKNIESEVFILHVPFQFELHYRYGSVRFQHFSCSDLSIHFKSVSFF